MLDFSERLYSLLASPYSFIQIRTFEEHRVVDTLRTLATQLGRPVLEWAPALESDDGGLLTMLTSHARWPAGAIVILKDAHPYLPSPKVVRCLRELEPELVKTGSALILVSPFVALPPELIKDVTFLDAPLPGRIELSAVFEEVFPPDRERDISPERLVSAALGLTMREAQRAFHRVYFERQQARRRADPDFDIEKAVIAEKRRLIEADRILEFCPLDENLDDVGGLDALKDWLRERERAFSAAATEFGLPTPKGVLLTGVQGCGKSLFAKAVASYWGIPLVRLDIARLFDGVMPPEAALQRAIQTAETLSPAVLWVDEIDKAFGENSGGSVSRMMGRLLSWLQDKTKPVFFVATANRVTHLPPELLRKGRFDEVFFVDLPSPDVRAQILEIHLRRRDRRPVDFDLAALAKQSDFFSGAELEQVVVSALFKAFAQDRKLAQVDLETAIQETIPLYRTFEDEIKGLRDWAQTRARSATRDRTLLDLFTPN